MRNPRIYMNRAMSLNETFALSEDAFGHVVRVLRLKEGDAITLFNGVKVNDKALGNYQEFSAILSEVSKKKANVTVNDVSLVSNESPVSIHLGQGISRGDRMDFTLQKSVELGVSSITPLFTERCGVKLNAERLAKKVDQWQKIVISACEQSGRCFVPEVRTPMLLSDWMDEQTDALKLNLHPRAAHSIMNLPVNDVEQLNVRLLIGPEGGLSDEEIASAAEANFTDVLLGPRVLRTETAALTAITALQCRFGDL